MTKLNRLPNFPSKKGKTEQNKAKQKKRQRKAFKQPSDKWSGFAKR